MNVYIVNYTECFSLLFHRNFENYFMSERMMEMLNKKLIFPYAYSVLGYF